MSRSCRLIRGPRLSWMGLLIFALGPVAALADLTQNPDSVPPASQTGVPPFAYHGSADSSRTQPETNLPDSVRATSGADTLARVVRPDTLTGRAGSDTLSKPGLPDTLPGARPSGAVSPAVTPDSIPLPARSDTLAAGAAADSLRRALGFPADTSARQIVPAEPPPPTTPAAPQAEAAEIAPILDTGPRTLPTGIGVYAGSPSFIGIDLVAPADGAIAFRSGFTVFPGVGILWTPGFEVRFGQEQGTYSRDGAYAFGNMFLGRTYPGADRRQMRTDLGLGYRWLLSDVRGFRWIAAAELGGQWQDDSMWPQRPCLRFCWLLAGK